ncbi:hypothetical protein LZC94_05520 [Pendulispora albinea]|uniref:Uncharacterized protein n=2 Tax=Pendulispora albinea TaxID=2741071 RepID=A0ABZ2MCV1_9BACT
MNTSGTTKHGKFTYYNSNTVGGTKFKNNGGVLPTTDGSGNPVTYTEYDIHPHKKGVNRGAERVVIGSDGRKWYTNDHYSTFTKM